MKNSQQLIKPVMAIMQKVLAHHAIISFLFFMITLILCVYSIQTILNIPDDEEFRHQMEVKNTKTSFDKKTIEQVKRLRSSNDTPVTLPSGRINPFEFGN